MSFTSKLFPFVCMRAEVLIHTGIVVQLHANERVNDEDPFFKKTHNVFSITDVLVEKKVLFVILGIWEFL